MYARYISILKFINFISFFNCFFKKKIVQIQEGELVRVRELDSKTKENLKGIIHQMASDGNKKKK